MKLKSNIVRNCINNALEEDCVENDITTKSLFAEDVDIVYEIIAYEEGIICGLPVVKEIFNILSNKVTIKFYFKDGGSIRKNDIIARISGPCHALFSAERVVLNFLSHLSGISTYTSKFVSVAKKNNVKILDTRKTIPGLRHLEKYAVYIGGGTNHRMNLSDMFLVKDNHIKLVSKHRTYNSIYRNIINKLRKKQPDKQIEIEVETLEQFKEVLLACPDIIMLDNMNSDKIKKAINIKKDLSISNAKLNDIELEASGGINLSNIAEYVNIGINRISIGSITNSATALDFSMEIKTIDA